MPTTAPPLIPADTLLELHTKGITHSEILDPDDARDARLFGAATARISSRIGRIADGHGLKVTPGTIHWENHRHSVGLFGADDPFRKTTITGTWKLPLPRLIPVTLAGGPNHGRTAHLDHHSIGRALDLPSGHTYQPHGYDPTAEAFLYRLARHAQTTAVTP